MSKPSPKAVFAPGSGDGVSARRVGPNGDEVVLRGTVLATDRARKRAAVAWEPNPLGLEMSAHLPLAQLGPSQKAPA